MSDQFLQLLPGVPETAQAIHRIFQASYRVEAKLLNIPAERFPPLQRSVEDFMASPTEFWAQTLDGELVGLAEITFARQELSICSFVVNPNYFRRGIGRQLLENLLQQFPWTKAQVETGADNLPAIRLYESGGFREVHRWEIPNLNVWKVKLAQTRNEDPSYSVS